MCQLPMQLPQNIWQLGFRILSRISICVKHCFNSIRTVQEQPVVLAMFSGVITVTYYCAFLPEINGRSSTQRWRAGFFPLARDWAHSLWTGGSRSYWAYLIQGPVVEHSVVCVFCTKTVRRHAGTRICPCYHNHILLR